MYISTVFLRDGKKNISIFKGRFTDGKVAEDPP